MLVKLRESPFYPKGGGQVADTGWIETDAARAAVEDVVRLDDDQVIVARLEHGELHKGERVRARVDGEARRPTMANHTATHLLHAALRGRLGDHVTQAGSYVGPDKLRFDFRHSAPLTPDELADVERVVNEHVVANHPLHIFVTSRDHARELGAMMLFGEKYGEHVRVVEVPEVEPRAVRRHPRALDRRDRPVRRHARDELRAGHPPDRGRHGRRRPGPPPGRGARGGSAPGAGRRSSRPRSSAPRGRAPPAADERRRGRPDRRRVGGGGRAHRRGRRRRRRRRPAPPACPTASARSCRRPRSCWAAMPAARRTSWRASTAAPRSAASRRST